jgi:tyrosyl-tRNA synthetase
MDRIDEVITRGVANIIPGNTELKNVLESDRKLNVYLGIDPTSVHIHLGHAVPLRKLQQLSELGHHVTFLIGDFTSLIGDTSDKDTERPVLTSEQIEANFRTYQEQASKILDFSRIKIRHNSEWLGKLGYADIIKLSRHFSLNDFISRELIKKRLTEGRSVSLPEVLYPVIQGYDSYFMDTDLQIGGTDQTFNMQAGRTLQKNLRSKESFVLTTGFLEGTDGRKMSKTWGNAIWMDDSPNDMYGKVMSLKDELIIQYFTLATNLPLPRVADIENQLSAAENPMHLKKELALQIVSELHSRQAAFDAREYFEKTVQSGEIPSDIPSFTIANSNIVEVLVESGSTPSKSEARRLIEQGGVEYEGDKITTPDFQITKPGVLKTGKRHFVKINL